jgi:hypothetical protein
MLIRVRRRAVTGCLFDELTTMGEDECLGGIFDGRDTVDEVGEDDLGRHDQYKLIALS